MRVNIDIEVEPDYWDAYIGRIILKRSKKDDVVVWESDRCESKDYAENLAFEHLVKQLKYVLR